MDVEKLIRRLRNDADAYRNGETLGRAFADQEDVLDNAATALSTLQAENEKLRAEVESLKKGYCAGCSIPAVKAEQIRDLTDAPKLRAELEQVKMECDAAKSTLAERIGVRGAEPITTAFGLPIDRLRELGQADREGRCVVLPCKIFDKIWNVAAHYQFEVTEIDLLPYGNILFRCGNKGTDDYAAFYGDDLGDTFTFEEPQERDNCVVKEAALRREQE